MTAYAENTGRITRYGDHQNGVAVLDRDGSRKRRRTLEGETVYDVTHSLAANASTTLWDASNDPVSGWKWAVIIVDPDNDYADDDPNAQVAVDFTASSVDSPAFVCRRELDTRLSSAAGGGPNTGAITAKTIAENAITRFRCWNYLNVATIYVRIILLK